MKKYTLFFLTLLFLIDSTIFSEELTWKDVVAQANKTNPQIVNALKTLENSKLNYRKSYSNFLPYISLSLGTSKSGNDSVTESQNYSAGVSGNLSLFNGFSEITEIKIQKINLKIEELNYIRKKSDIICNLKRNFINLIWAKENVELAKKILERTENNLQLLKVKYESGREDKGSLLRVEADKLQAELNLEKAKRNLETIKIQLLTIMGLDIKKDIDVKGQLNFENKISEPEFGKIKQNIPEYKIALLNVEYNKLTVKRVSGNFLPDISISAGISSTGKAWPPDGKNWHAGLNLSYPLFTGFTRYYDLKTIKNNLEIAEENLRRTELEIDTNMKILWNNLLDAIADLTIRQKMFEASEEQAKITSVKYMNGLISYYDWYNVENNLINSQRALLSAKKDVIFAEISWKNFYGETFEDEME